MSGNALVLFACSALVNGHMLSNEEEVQLVESLQVAEGDAWLKLLYRCNCKKVWLSSGAGNKGWYCSCSCKDARQGCVRARQGLESNSGGYLEALLKP